MATQTDNPTTSDSESQTTDIPLCVNVETQTPMAAHCITPDQPTTTEPAWKPVPKPAPRTSIHHLTATISTSNRFSVLPIEDCNNTSVPESIPTVATRCKPTPKKSTPKQKPVPKPRTIYVASSSPAEPTRPVPAPRTIISHSSSTLDASTHHQRKSVLIIGDSIPKYLIGSRMSKRCVVLNRCIPGTHLESWISLAPIVINEVKPSAVIIHCGTNNISSDFVHETVELYRLLADVILKVDPTIQIIASSLTTQLNVSHSTWIREFNARLQELCHVNKWTYANNNNITTFHLARADGLHLSRKGTSLLAQNFITHIRQFCNQDFHKMPTSFRKR